jgi:hypothetical protein
VRPTAKYNRDVIQAALGGALGALSEELELEPSDGPELDHDTKDAKGMAAIADTIFEKIQNSGVFVGDLTTVGKSDGGRELSASRERNGPVSLITSAAMR